MGVRADIRDEVRKETVTKIHGQPTNHDLTILEKELIAILANIPTTLGGGNHGHAGIIMNPDRYLLIAGVPFINPTNPGNYPENVAGNAAAGVRAKVEAEHKEQVREYETFQGVVQATKDIILEAVDHEFLLEIEDEILGFLNQTPTDILTHLRNRGGALDFADTKTLLAEQNIAASVSIIDLSQDFRLAANATIADRTFVYGLPELNREKIATAKNIANPGCFATAIQLALLPLAKSGLLQDIYTTGITGSTGAGQSLSATSHFSWRANNIQAYKTLDHQHVFEIVQSLNQLQADAPLSASGEGPGLHFVPWRGDFTRGIYTSSVIDCSLPLEAVQEMYDSYYAAHPFVVVSETPIHLKQVVNTNKCVLQIEKQGNKLVVHSAIDNLIKGASGQAVQNMNLLFGLDETTGLLFKANFF